MVLPKEHGTWMMFFLPVILGSVLSGPNVYHLLFGVGWFFVYLSSTPLLAMIRNKKFIKKMYPWFLGYVIIGTVLLIPVLIKHPSILYAGAFIAPMFALNVYFIKKKNERSLWNDLSGIITFSLGGVGAYLIGETISIVDSIVLLLIPTSYFMGSAFYVKSLIRERKNPAFSKKSHIFHGLLLVFPWLLGLPWLMIAYLPGVIKDWVTPRSRFIKPIVSGITEIVNGVVFLILCIIVLI